MEVIRNIKMKSKDKKYISDGCDQVGANPADPKPSDRGHSNAGRSSAVVPSLTEKVREYTEEKHLLSEGEAVLVALSGGADSVALLLVLKELGYKVYAYHLNHGLRGADADADEAYCRELCEANGIPFFGDKADVSNISGEEKISFEDAGRKIRYRGLQRVADAHGISKIATGHHMGDAAETFIMNAMRGAGLDGLCSIPYRSIRQGERAENLPKNPEHCTSEVKHTADTRRTADARQTADEKNTAGARVSVDVNHRISHRVSGMRDVKSDEAREVRYPDDSDSRKTVSIVRPLLCAEREEIVRYLRDDRVEWREDATNQSEQYLRNRVRKVLDAAAVKKIGDCIALISRDRDYIDAAAEEAFDRHVRDCIVPERTFLFSSPEVLHPSIASRVVRNIVSLLVGNTVDLSSRHIDSALSLHKVGSRTEVGTGARKVNVYRTYEGLEFSLASAPRSAGNAPGIFSAAAAATVAGISSTGTSSSPEQASVLDWTDLRDEREHPVGRVRMKDIGNHSDVGKDGRRHDLDANRILIDINKVKGVLRVRSRKTGDEIIPFGMKGKKTIKKLLIDEKVDRRLRDILPIVVDDEKIIWVAGVRMSETVRVGRGARAVLLELTDFL